MKNTLNLPSVTKALKGSVGRTLELLFLGFEPPQVVAFVKQVKKRKPKKASKK